MTKTTATKNQQTESSESDVSLIRIDRVYESLRYNDYSAQNGLGEIVDNSVEAGSSNIAVRLTVEKLPNQGRKKTVENITEIAVIDDGCGMDQETLHRCLALGESIRMPKHGKRGIGRFGVGMTLGGISLARRIEVYSRTRGKEDFLYTYIDLEEIRDQMLLVIPTPIRKEPPSMFMDLLSNSSGTIVILKKCDRVEGDIEGFSNYLGRTYRKFIERGLSITLNEEPVYLHDPLYMSGPTLFDVKRMETEGVMEPKATLIDEGKISLEIPGSEGETADVVIRISLLPQEWRNAKGVGGNSENRKRKIDQNEGVSILRADREVLYGYVPYITGKKGEARALDIDRWWGCEISFPPELDDYFQVRYIKRGAEPVASLRDKIREFISGSVKVARKMVQEDWDKKRSEEASKEGTFQKAEKVMARADGDLPRGKKGKNLTEAENESNLDKVAASTLGEERNDQTKLNQKKEELRNKPYAIELVSYNETVLFETDYLMKNTIIRLNINHPFYKQVLQPLCGDLEEDDSQESHVSKQQQDIKNAILLLLFSYAKAEAMFDNHEQLFKSLRSQWGTALASALNYYEEED